MLIRIHYHRIAPSLRNGYWHNLALKVTLVDGVAGTALAFQAEGILRFTADFAPFNLATATEIKDVFGL
jgi:hypothetical protein